MVSRLKLMCLHKPGAFRVELRYRSYPIGPQRRAATCNARQVSVERPPSLLLSLQSGVIGFHRHTFFLRKLFVSTAGFRRVGS
jgi:hypothetical protein